MGLETEESTFKKHKHGRYPILNVLYVNLIGKDSLNCLMNNWSTSESDHSDGHKKPEQCINEILGFVNRYLG